jgi:3-dehydroquinate dehydratase II
VIRADGEPGRPRLVGIVHGPNLRLLGRREPDHYGTTTLEAIDRSLESLAAELGAELRILQSNHEGEILDWIESVAPEVDGFVVNPGGLTHTSVVLRDALLAADRPFVEVHLSNTASREGFRHRSFLSDRALGVVYGFGADSYLLGLRGLLGRNRT